MVEILKHGDVIKDQQSKTFECGICGCIFMADNDEYALFRSNGEKIIILVVLSAAI